MLCEKCGGKLHYLSETGYRRCEDCFVPQAELPSSIPCSFQELTVDDIGLKVNLRFNKEAMTVINLLRKRLENRELPKKIPVFEAGAGEVTPLVAVLMNFACSFQLSVERVLVSQLTEFYFNDRNRFFNFFSFDVLFIQLRAGIDTSANVGIVDELIQERQSNSKITVISVETNDLHPSFKTLFSRPFFKRVKLK